MKCGGGGGGGGVGGSLVCSSGLYWKLMMSPVQRQREKERASSTTAGTIDLREAETWHQRRGEWEGARRGAFNVAAWTKAELSEGETEEKLRAAVCFHERWPDSLYAYYLLFLLDSLTISCWCATSLKPRHMNTCADWGHCHCFIAPKRPI